MQRYEIVNEAENEGTVDKETNESAGGILLRVNHVLSPMVCYISGFVSDK